jgi:hypothetical protein
MHIEFFTFIMSVLDLVRLSQVSEQKQSGFKPSTPYHALSVAPLLKQHQASRGAGLVTAGSPLGLATLACHRSGQGCWGRACAALRGGRAKLA